jgi:alpha-L-rhamnosidase
MNPNPIILLVALVNLTPLAHAAPLVPVALRAESLPPGATLAVTAPQLSWQLKAADPAARGLAQGAYEIQAARADSGVESADLWASGKVAGRATHAIAWGGAPLASRDRVVWRVRVWDQEGAASAWSEPATFAVGLLEVADWQAEWISPPGDDTFWTSDNIQNHKDDPVRGRLKLAPARHLRREFSVAGGIKRATLHATALGVYAMEINGRPIGDQFLAPGWTNYHRRLHSQSYDVTAHLAGGANAIGATLGDGWYAGYVAYGLLTGVGGLDPEAIGRAYYGTVPALLAQLEIELADGSVQVVATDTSWKSGQGPITETDILMGEAYDARREIPGWSKPGFDDSAWPAAARRVRNGADILPHPGPPVRVIEELPPRSVREHAPGRFIFDLGQNISGVVRLKVKGPAGTKVTLRFAEMLHKDGSLSTENLRCARAVDTYTLKGDPAGETWTPLFTYHGFQFVELAGFPGTPGNDALTGLVIHSDTPLAGRFTCNDEVLNRLHRNIVWTQRGNFFEMPTDCPQRDERMGWTGDAQIYVRAAAANADIESFYRKWLRDLNDDQWGYGAYPNFAPRPFVRPGMHHAAGWMDAGVICPWTIWQVYGDTRVIDEHWTGMTRFMGFREKRDPQLTGRDDDCGFGDWLSLGDTPVPIPFIDLAYHGYCAKLMAEMAAATNRPAEAARYRARFAKIAAAFARRHLKQDARLDVHTQSAYAMALFFDLIPAGRRQAAAGHLAGLIRANGNKMTTGFLGTRPLLPVLSATGHHDLAGILAQQREFPSWGYEVVNGATTIWERWNSYTKEGGVHEPSMNSFSHYAFGAVCEWLIGRLAGLDLAAPGFDEILVRPRPTGTLTRVAAAHPTRHGELAIAWKLAGGTFTAEVTIPPNTRAIIDLPVAGPPLAGGQPAAGQPGLTPGPDGRLTAGSGSYSFSGPYQAD